jgi:hypothetical protein
MTSPEICCVCEEPLTSTTEAYCGECNRPYHLNQRADIPGKDCGRVWINEDHLALEFACDLCLYPPQATGLDDVLDLAEAAAEAGMTEDWISGEADAGRLRHRKTSAGILLFERRDVIAFREGRQ